MKDYRKLKRNEDGSVSGLDHVPLFSDREKEKAECVLKALDGMNSTQAFSFLDKCKTAVLQCRISVDD